MTSAVTGAEMGDAYADPETAMPKVVDQLYSRPPWERMMRIHERIQAGNHPNCNQLAREFEVSSRTIKRDIDFMKCRLELPIEYDDRRYGYYYSKPVQQFPGVRITEPELFALLVAQKAIVQYHGTPFEKPLETAFRKLTAQLSPDSEYTFHNLERALSFRPLGPEDTDLALFQRLNAALRERRVLRFRYRNLGTTKAQTRRVDPFHVACVDNRWYLFAYDRARKAMRTFALSRMHRPELMKDRFERAAKFNPDEYLRGSFGVFKGQDDFEVVIEFDAWAADLLHGRRWHPSQAVIEFPKGGLRMRLRLNNIEEIERWVLGWGKHATVIRPKMLAKRIEQAAADMLRKYKEAPDRSEAPDRRLAG